MWQIRGDSTCVADYVCRLCGADSRRPMLVSTSFIQLNFTVSPASNDSSHLPLSPVGFRATLYFAGTTYVYDFL